MKPFLKFLINISFLFITFEYSLCNQIDILDTNKVVLIGNDLHSFIKSIDELKETYRIRIIPKVNDNKLFENLCEKLNDVIILDIDCKFINDPNSFFNSYKFSSNIMSLYLYNINVKVIPNSIVLFNKTQHLEIIGNYGSLPDNFNQLYDLEDLTINSKNFIFDHSFQLELKKLRQLTISNSSETMISNQLNKCTNLETIHFDHCNSFQLDSTLTILNKLRFIDLWECVISNKNHLFNCLAKFKKLTKINIIDCSLNQIPDEIELIINLEYLDLSNNKIEVINPKLFKLLKLESLYFLGNPLYELDEGFYKIPKLRNIQFNGTKIPISQLEDLKLKRRNVSLIW
ncbi:MAG: hypothetical protein NTW25_15235 [Candidatus Kapabacteria bacterium]|nr:hypothetical protein [Candidatus Kapabacteria bacterium]